MHAPTGYITPDECRVMTVGKDTAVAILEYPSALAMLRRTLDGKAGEINNAERIVKFAAAKDDATRRYFDGMTLADMRAAVVGDYPMPDTYSAVVAALPPIGDDVDARTVRTVAGYRPNVGAACAGSVRSMYATRHDVANDVPVRICVDGAGYWAEPARSFNNHMAGVVAAALSLQQSGGAVELFVCNIAGNGGRGVVFPVAPVDLSPADPITLGCITSGAMLRQQYFYSQHESMRPYVSHGANAVSVPTCRAIVRAWSALPTLYVPSVWPQSHACPTELLTAARTSAVAVRDYVLSRVDELLNAPTTL